MFFQAVYFGHFLSFYTMQLEPPKSNTSRYCLGFFRGTLMI